MQSSALEPRGARLAMCFKLLKIAEPLADCWVIDNHWDHELERRTAVGDLLRKAKTYDNDLGDPDAARSLAARMGAEAVGLVSRGLIGVPDVVVAVPSNPPKVPHDLPSVLAEGVSSALQVPFDLALLLKRAPTQAAKMNDRPSTVESLRGVFEVTVDIRGRRVLLVDDVVRTGATLSAIGRVLIDRGAHSGSRALVATRATKGMAP